jgi:MFS family permease
MRFGPRRVLLAGQALIAVALAVLALGPLDSVYLRDVFVPLVLLGLGGGLSFPSLTILAMSDASPKDSGLASGLLNTTGQVGGSLGLAVLATLSGAWTSRLLADGRGSAAALGGGYHLAWMVGAGVFVVAILLTVVLMRSKTAVATEERLGEGEAAA